MSQFDEYMSAQVGGVDEERLNKFYKEYKLNCRT